MKAFKILTAVAASLLLAGSASGLTLAFDDSRVLGFAWTGTDDNSTASDRDHIDALLDKALGYNMPPTCPPGTTPDPDYHRTLNDPLGGVYPDASGGTDVAIPTFDVPGAAGTSFLYLLGKYDGPNSYRVVWYIGDLAPGTEITLPDSFSEFPDGGTQYGLSHTRVFNNGPSFIPTPDGGSTVLLLGIAITGIAIIRRFA